MRRTFIGQKATIIFQQFVLADSSLRDERLPKGTRFASESLDADTSSGSVWQTDTLPCLFLSEKDPFHVFLAFAVMAIMVSNGGGF
jgi:hypothetical protein